MIVPHPYNEDIIRRIKYIIIHKANKKRQQAIWKAFLDLFKPGENHITSFFYYFKAIYCIFMRRKKDLWLELDGVTVAMWNIYYPHEDPDFGIGIDPPELARIWDELIVGRGIFKNWHYDIYLNGNY
jgi:hypothetical protein